MNLIVATRTENKHIRFEVDGRWHYGDALKLAYVMKAAQSRASLARFLVDLRRVSCEPGSEEKFMVCDRLLRVFQPPVRIALVGDSTLIDSETAAVVSPDTARIAVFVRERDALAWLMT
ncbi:MAG: hypothetical protein JWQ33_1155 [Ramlibacter sp.]|nr:hypothetical protein [Ramlibacter sp.]